MSKEDLAQALTTVKKLRVELDYVKSAYQHRREAFEASEYEAIASIHDISRQLDLATGMARNEALNVFWETNDKQPIKGVKIIQQTHLLYDVKDAFEWAKEKGLALSLDKLEFDKIAKATPIDFVTITKEPFATLAKEL